MTVKTTLKITTVLNTLDLITSFYDFHLGYTELNGFTTILHLNPYISALIAIILYQILTTALYLLSRYRLCRYLLYVLTVMKALVVIHNALLAW